MASTSDYLEPVASQESRRFAKEWHGTLLFGLVVYGGYRLIVNILLPLLEMQFNFMATALRYPILIYYGPSLLFLGIMFVVHRLVWYPDIRFVGTWSRRDLVVGIATITALYFAGAALEYQMGQPRELIMASLYQSKTTLQIVVLVASLLVLPPIVEELAFRHFLLSILPFRANRIVATIAVVATAVYFSHVHDYQHWTTDAEMFLIGVILAIARIRTNGMLLPIALHAYAIALALLIDQAIRLLGR